MKLPSEWTTLLDQSSLPVMILNREFKFVYANDAYLEAVERKREEIIGEYVFDIFPESPDRVESVLEPWRRTLDGETTTLESLPFNVTWQDGSVEERVWQATQDPVRDEDGQIIGLIQRTQDITERYQLEQRNKAIGYELSHRVKNIMAVVSSVARITCRNASYVSEFVQSFTARISAMSRTNDLLAKGDWAGLDVETIFKDELSPFDEAEIPPYSLHGSRVKLNIDATKDLSMVAHELATNAVKYGCLGKTGGHLKISWGRKSDKLVIDWVETCPHAIKTSESVGFGTRLFDMLPYVDVTRNFTPNGLHLTIEMDGEKVFA